MSYILDALKKSEQQRLAVGVPSLNSTQAVPIESGSTRRNWQLVAVVLLAANAGALGWWLASGPDRPRSVPAQQAAAAQPSAAPAPAMLPEPPASAPPSVSSPAAATESVPAPAQPASLPPLSSQVTGEVSPPASVPLAERIPPAGQSAPRLRQDQTFAGRKLLPERTISPSAPRDSALSGPAERNPAVTPSASTSAPSGTPRATPPSEQVPAAAAPTASSGVVAFGDLPASVRNALPPLEIGGYAEGPGGAAMLVVDDHLVREGDEVGPGVRVVKISPDGAVFSYRNYRFRR